MMYIKKIVLKDVRCFEHVEIDLSGSKPGTSILIAGNNGIGKSAILRAIAMGVCDRDSAASLLRELEGNFIRSKASAQPADEGETHAEIDITLTDESAVEWNIKTSVVEWKQQIIERVRQEYDGEDTESAFVKFSGFWSKLFVAGYGAGLRTTANAKFTDYFAPDAVYSLFKYDTPLQDPELAWRRFQAAGSKSGTEGADEMIREILRHVLDLPQGAEISLEPDGIYVTEHQTKKALDAMGDGHKALVKVTLDILVWYLLKINYSDSKGEDRNWKSIPLDRKRRPTISGIIIIDEIEQHLHPKLQREVLKRLHEKFPKVQFIITTHSPLCLSGTADVVVDEAPGYQVYTISKRDSGDADVVQQSVPLGLTTDQILVEYFGLPTTLNVTLEKKYLRLSSLIAKDARSASEQVELKKLTNEISQSAPMVGETIAERKLMFDLRKMSAEMMQLLKGAQNDKAD